MKRLLLALLVIVASVAPALAQSCATPAPTYTPTPGYQATVLAADNSNLLVYYPMDETTGTTAIDHAGHADATYSGVTLNIDTFLTGDPAGSWDGINDAADIYTSYLHSNFSSTEGTAMIWAKVGAGFWTDNLTRYFLNLRLDINNRVFINKQTSNALRMSFTGNSTAKTTDTTPTPTGWFVMVITWSAGANKVNTYQDGNLISSMTGVPAWSGGTVPTLAFAGGNTAAGSSPYLGNLAQVAIWKSALNATQVAELATVDPILTIPPTPTLCPTYTPTPTPTHSPTPTPTPTNTFIFDQYWTLPAPETTGTPAPGQPVVFHWGMSAGQAGISLMLSLIIFSLIAMALVAYFMRRRSKRPPPGI